MPGKRDFADGTGRATGRIKAVITHGGYGLGPLVQRAADMGHDPGADQVNAGYLRNPQGPRPDVLDKYMNAAALVPAPTGYGNGYPRLPRYHQLSAMPVMGDDLYALSDQRGQ